MVLSTRWLPLVLLKVVTLVRGTLRILLSLWTVAFPPMLCTTMLTYLVFEAMILYRLLQYFLNTVCTLLP